MLELGKHSKKLHLEQTPIINSSSIDTVHVIGKFVKETYKNIYSEKKGLILKETSQIIDLIKHNIDNNDYIMIKGSNSTGLNKLTGNLKVGKFNALGNSKGFPTCPTLSVSFKYISSFNASRNNSPTCIFV